MAIIYAAVFAVYNLLIFLIFNNFNNIFWISYGFMTAALITNVIIILIASKKTDVEAAFFGIPLMSFSIFHVIAESGDSVPDYDNFRCTCNHFPRYGSNGIGYGQEKRL